jgi:hypothetical protein
MQSKFVLGGLFAAISVFAFGVATPITAQQADALSNLADARELTAKGAWKKSVTYDKDDLVTSRGSTWRSKRDNNKGNEPGSTKPNTDDDWQLFARGFNPEGAWKGSKTYHADDIVRHLGETWRAKRTSTNKTPASGANWERWATAGDDGTQGTQGPQGPQGIQGIQGPPGPNTGVPAGNPSMPGISFDGDADTGIFSPAAGKIALVENGQLFLHNRGTNNTALGQEALISLDLPNGTGNTALGRTSLMSNTTGQDNTAVGRSALVANTSGIANVAVGADALGVNSTGDANVAIGNSALFANTVSDNTAVGTGALLATQTGVRNTAVGRNALLLNQNGEHNIAIGYSAGASAGDLSHGIYIGNNGASAVANSSIWLGTTGTHTATFIAGIRGVTTAVADAIPVLIGSTGQLGTTSSSARYKFDVATMPDMTAMLSQLRPVTFRYKQGQDGGTHPLQYGLIAEEVAEVFPDLAVFNKDGSPETVKYHLLPSFLLAGYQQQQKVIEAQASEIAELKQRLLAIEALLPRVTKAAAVQ